MLTSASEDTVGAVEGGDPAVPPPAAVTRRLQASHLAPPRGGPDLWSGQLDGGQAGHAQLGLIKGYFPSRPPRGSCEVRGARPNLWGPVARALGFTVRTSRYQSGRFKELLAAADITPRSCHGGRVRWREAGGFAGSQLPSVVFSDTSMLPHSGDVGYWACWRVPHVFFGNEEGPAPPAGWGVRAERYHHAALGGSTTASAVLSVWYPPGHRPMTPVDPPDQPWVPLLSCLNRLNDGGLAAPPGAHALERRVLTLGASGVVRPEGLFPHDAVTATVVAPAPRSQTGFVCRSLTIQELGTVWNVPISMLDSVEDTKVDVAVMADVLLTPPARLLYAGTDALLTASFRGGTGRCSRKRTRDRISEGGSPEGGNVPFGGDLQDGSEKLRAPMSTQSTLPTELDSTVGDSTALSLHDGAGEACNQAAGGRFHLEPSESSGPPTKRADTRPVSTIELDLSQDQDNVGLDLPPGLDLSREHAGEVVKQEGQKADNAGVPTRLWSQFFAKTFLAKFPLRKVMPAGWQLAQEGFRQFGIRMWRRQLMRDFSAWRTRYFPVNVAASGRKRKTGKLVTARYVKDGGGLKLEYVWADEGRGLNCYKFESRQVLAAKLGAESMEVAWDALRQVMGPFNRDHPQTHNAWWKWQDGSTPFY